MCLFFRECVGVMTVRVLGLVCKDVAPGRV